jgi:hypothetical protein
MPHRLVILEIEGRKGADLDPAVPLDLGDPLALIVSYRGVTGCGQDIFPRQAMVAD